MLVRLSNSGHYPSRVIEVTADELSKLREIEREHGYLDAGFEANKEFLAGIYARPEAGPRIVTVIKYQ